MGADLARARQGKPTRTGMSASKLEEMARKPKQPPRDYSGRKGAKK